MKIVLCQLNATVGDIAGNAARIEAAAQKAFTLGAQLAVFPELSLVGYPPRDLVDRVAFLDASDKALASLRVPCPVIVGAPVRSGERLYNAPVLLAPIQAPRFFPKTLLPTYDVFDEARYFTPAKDPNPLIEIGGVRIGISVCEDIWNDGFAGVPRHYPRNPIAALAEAGAQVMVNISASPFEAGKRAFREGLLQDVAQKHHVAVLYCNQVAGNDSLLFDGSSLFVSKTAKVVGRAAAFTEDFLVCDLATESAPIAAPLEQYDELYQALVFGIRDYAQKCAFKTAVIGLSGGIDSALTAVLAADALGPDNIFGVAMPSRYSSQGSIDDAAALAKNLGIHFQTLPIEAAFVALRDTLGFSGRPEEDLAEQNTQARIRGTLLMALANRHNHLLITTGNRSELATGYCTLYGDMCGGLAAISDVYKTDVYALSRFINRQGVRIPQSSIDKPPSAELKPNQVDQDTLPPYDTLDAILRAYLDERKALHDINGDPALIKRIAKMIQRSEYKRRQAAPGLKIGPQAFGEGRRYPIAQRFEES